MGTSEAGSANWVIEVTEADFESAVFQRSRQVPIVLDFWAPWCAPCRALGPVLEGLAREMAGKFVLAKVNVDREPGLAAAFGVQGIPAVFAIRDRRVIDQFAGALPERELRMWLSGLLPTAAENLLSTAKELESGSPETAEAQYRQALAAEPDLAAAKIGLARVLAGRGAIDESRQLLDDLAARGFLEPEAECIASQIWLKRQAVEAGPPTSCREALAASPQDSQKQLQLARSLAGAGQYEEALQTCLHLVQADRKASGEQAREIMVHIFRALGPDSDLVSTYRRKLSQALY
jgi:putative thioredoxin